MLYRLVLPVLFVGGICIASLASGELTGLDAVFSYVSAWLVSLLLFFLLASDVLIRYRIKIGSARTRESTA